MRASRFVEKAIIYFLLITLSVVFVFPFFHALMTSLKKPVDAFTMPPVWIFKPSFKYHVQIWAEKHFFEYLINSLIVAGTTVLISVPIASLAAYGLVRHRSRLTFFILLVLLSIRMFPRMLLVIPYFVMSLRFNLHDTRLIMILITVAFNQPFAIWLMRGFLMSIPMELDEAAVVDGCSYLGIFRRVIFPLALPGMATTAIFSFLLAYNDFLFPLILTGSKAKTLPVAIAQYGAESIEYWSISAAGAIGITTPVIIFMLFLQRYFVEGLTSGAVKY